MSMESVMAGIEFVPFVGSAIGVGLGVWACEEIGGNQYGPCEMGREPPAKRNRIFVIGTFVHAVLLFMIWYLFDRFFGPSLLMPAIFVSSFLLVTWISKKSLYVRTKAVGRSLAHARLSLFPTADNGALTFPAFSGKLLPIPISYECVLNVRFLYTRG